MGDWASYVTWVKDRVFVVGPLVHAGLARLRGWETVLWASDATWVHSMLSVKELHRGG